jgi:hypothetical protein
MGDFSEALRGYNNGPKRCPYELLSIIVLDDVQGFNYYTHSHRVTYRECLDFIIANKAYNIMSFIIQSISTPAYLVEPLRLVLEFTFQVSSNSRFLKKIIPLFDSYNIDLYYVVEVNTRAVKEEDIPILIDLYKYLLIFVKDKKSVRNIFDKIEDLNKWM